MKELKFTTSFSWMMLAVLLVGCQTVAPTSTPAPVEPTTSPSPALEATATATPGLEFITLTLWAPDFLSAYQDEEQLTVFNKQLEDFSRLHS